MINHFGLLRKKIIVPAIKELIDKNGWLIDWRPTHTGPVTEMDLLVNPGLAMGYPVICGNDCYMLPMMTMPLYAKILNLMEQYEEKQRTEADPGSERDSEN